MQLISLTVSNAAFSRIRTSKSKSTQTGPSQDGRKTSADPLSVVHAAFTARGSPTRSSTKAPAPSRTTTGSSSNPRSRRSSRESGRRKRFKTYVSSRRSAATPCASSTASTEMGRHPLPRTACRSSPTLLCCPPFAICGNLVTRSLLKRLGTQRARRSKRTLTNGGSVSACTPSRVFSS